MQPLDSNNRGILAGSVPRCGGARLACEVEMIRATVFVRAGIVGRGEKKPILPVRIPSPAIPPDAKMQLVRRTEGLAVLEKPKRGPFPISHLLAASTQLLVDLAIGQLDAPAVAGLAPERANQLPLSLVDAPHARWRTRGAFEVFDCLRIVTVFAHQSIEAGGGHDSRCNVSRQRLPFRAFAPLPG